jgi:hypothetical protein
LEAEVVLEAEAVLELSVVVAVAETGPLDEPDKTIGVDEGLALRLVKG